MLAFGRPLTTVEGDGPDALEGLTHALVSPVEFEGDTAALAPFPFRGGAIGFFGYECQAFFERVPAHRGRVLGLPRLRFTIPRTFLLTRSGAPAVLCGVRGDGGQTGADALDDLRALEGAPRHPSSAARAIAVVRRWSRAHYLQRVDVVREHILAGDLYQANLTQAFDATGVEDPLTVFQRLARDHPTPFAAFLGFGDHAVVSASPELFLRRRGSRVETRPIKGTRPRTGDAERDAAALRELEASEKDRAELAMIVDLERNDLSRVCRVGSVRVRTPRALEAYASLFHGVATVEGELLAGSDLRGILAATFPSGSITGCPKIRAMEILAGLEQEPRGPSFGALGWVGYDGDLDLNVAIRTIAFAREGGVWNASFRTGGGIVFDSRADDEYRESLVKAKALAKALGDARFSSDG